MDNETNVADQQEEVVEQEDVEHSLKRICNIIYLCLTLGFFTFGISALGGIVLAYLKKGKARGTWLASHFTWQIWTFWVPAVVAVIWRIVFWGQKEGEQNLILSSVFFIALFAAFIWVIYRIIRGWTSLGRGMVVKGKAE